MASNSLEEYKIFVANYLRDFEYNRSASDPTKRKELEQTSDDDLMRKWLWIGTIVGSMACVATWLVFNFLGGFIPFILMQLLWTMLKAGMGLVVIIGGLTAYFTFRKSDQRD